MGWVYAFGVLSGIILGVTFYPQFSTAYQELYAGAHANQTVTH